MYSLLANAKFTIETALSFPRSGVGTCRWAILGIPVLGLTGTSTLASLALGPSLSISGSAALGKSPISSSLQKEEGSPDIAFSSPLVRGDGPVKGASSWGRMRKKTPDPG